MRRVFLSVGSKIIAVAAIFTTLSLNAKSVEIKVDGSSTVGPISKAVAEDFQATVRSVRVPTGESGTGGGFKKFLKNEIDVNGASRAIKGKEQAEAKRMKIKFQELRVAYDGISIVVHKNSPVSSLTKSELKKIWAPKPKGAKDHPVQTWGDVRAEWKTKPWGQEKIKLFGPGTDSGTFDFFTKKIVGKEKSSRADYSASEDDNQLVTGVQRTKGALGYFGFAYYIQNKNKLKLLGILDPKTNTAIQPNLASIKDGSYPLSRPLFIYVNAASIKKPLVKEYVNFYLKQAETLSAEVGYIPLEKTAYQAEISKFQTWTKSL